MCGRFLQRGVLWICCYFNGSSGTQFAESRSVGGVCGPPFRIKKAPLLSRQQEDEVQVVDDAGEGFEENGM